MLMTPTTGTTAWGIGMMYGASRELVSCSAIIVVRVVVVVVVGIAYTV